ncbi:MAG: hypothetical protein FWE62_02795 [Firmicutes bacterium]|nr:hypothetical protein [Bacillota bacterium]
MAQDENGLHIDGEAYCGHYIRVDGDDFIVYGFSTAFEAPVDGDICIDERGGYQFRLVPGGVENPALHTEDGEPLYRWVNGAVAGV